MPIHTKYDKEKDILFTSLTGVVTITEIENVIQEVLQKGEFSPDVDTLVDISNLNFDEIDANFLNRVISLEKQNVHRAGARVAFVAGSDLDYGMSRMYISLSDELPKTSRVFNSHAEGETWLLESKGSE